MRHKHPELDHHLDGHHGNHRMMSCAYGIIEPAVVADAAVAVAANIISKAPSIGTPQPQAQPLGPSFM